MFKSRTFEGEEVPKLTKWLYCGSGMFRDLCYQFVSMFLLMFAQYCGIGQNENYVAMYSVITVIIIILRIWDGFNDPIIDNTSSSNLLISTDLFGMFCFLIFGYKLSVKLPSGCKVSIMSIL